MEQLCRGSISVALLSLSMKFYQFHGYRLGFVLHYISIAFLIYHKFDVMYNRDGLVDIPHEEKEDHSLCIG